MSGSTDANGSITYLAPRTPWSMPRVPAPSFSVVIPAYEAAGVISEAIESALTQTSPALEVIVCDDGSTDDLAAALEPYRSRVLLTRENRGGVAAARNAGLRLATGDFVAMLDSDDAYLPERLEALGELASIRPDLDVLATDAYLEVEGVVAGRFHEQTPFAVDDQRTAILDRCFFGWPAIRRSRLVALGGFDETLRTGSDWECAVRLVLSGCRVGLVDIPLYRYRLRERSLTSERVGTLADRVRLLELATAHPTLDAAERSFLRRSLTSKRRKLLRAEAEVGLTARAPGARVRAIRLALAARVPLAERVEALSWAAAPAHAARRLEEVARRHTDLVSASPWQRAGNRRDRRCGGETGEDGDRG